MSILSTTTLKKVAQRAALALSLGSLITLFTSAQAFAAVNKCGPARVNNSRDFCTDNLQSLTDGLAWYALAACVTGIFVSATLWALGSKGQNPGQELTGKRGLILCCAAAFCIGGAVPFIEKINEDAQHLDSKAGSTTPNETCYLRNNCNVDGSQPDPGSGGAGGATANDLEKELGN